MAGGKKEDKPDGIRPGGPPERETGRPPGASAPRWGPLGRDRFWLELTDGRMFAIDEETRRVVEDLLRGLSPGQIARERDVEEEDVRAVAQLLSDSIPAGETAGETAGMEPAEEATPSAPVSRPSPERRHVASNEARNVVDAPGGSFDRLPARAVPTVLFIAAVLAASAVIQIRFVAAVPPVWVAGLADQWLVAGALTVGLILHATGHWLITPREIPGRVRLVWFGPIPLLSLINTELWKWPRWRRIAVDAAGAGMDLAVGGVAAALGLLRPELGPFVWSFLFVHWIRMCLALIPLFQGDGYFLLVDWLGRPNLWGDAIRSLKARRLHWLSLYALLRVALQGLSWVWFWAWVVQAVHMWRRLLVEGAGWSLLVHPAVIFVCLSVAAQAFGWVRWIAFRASLARRMRNGVAVEPPAPSSWEREG